MEAYPPQYVEHNLPLVLLSGLGHEESRDQSGTPARRQESGARIINESPVCKGDRPGQLLQEFQVLDGTGLPWNALSLPGPVGAIRYKVKAIGRTYTLPARKAAPLPQSPDAGVGPLPRNSELHSPLSPLSPGSPIFPDGLFTPLWFSKHQEQVPCLILAFFDLNVGEASTQDEQIKNDINAIRSALTRSGFKTRFAAVLMADKSILHAPELEDRLSAIRRATGLDPKSALFFMPPMPSQPEMATFIQSLMMTLQPSLVEYYRDLTKHARRKKTKGAPTTQTTSQAVHASHLIPTSGWNVRYEVKQGAFAEFRQEMDVAERHYSAAIEELFNPEGIFEITASWNVRWDQARLLCDAMALRVLRCHLWTGQTVAATQFWTGYKARIKDLIDRRGKGSQTYGWDAWEARWAGVMSQLIQLADVPGLQKPTTGSSVQDIAAPTVYAFPEKAFSPADRLIPFHFLHHPGYWFRLFANGIRERWEKALALPEEDRVPPGQSPASTMVMRSKSYDTYLVCEPHDEYPLSGPGRYDYPTELSAVCARATEEFEARGQSRMTEQMQLHLAQDFIRAGRYADATQVLLRLWEDSTWREDDWHALFYRVLRLLSECFHRDRSPENAKIIPALTWERLGLGIEDKSTDALDLSQCLSDWEISDKVSIALANTERLCPVSASFAFQKTVSHVGELIQFQLILRNKSKEASKDIAITSVEVSLDSLGIVILHQRLGDASFTSSEHHIEALELIEGAQGVMSADANLTLSAGHTRIYSSGVTLKQAQVVRATQITISVDSEKFTLVHRFTDDALLQSRSWFVETDGKVDELLLPHTETRSINVLSKPPKMKLVFDNLHERYYTDERIRLSVTLVNEETEVVDGQIIPTIVGQNDNTLPFAIEGSDDGDMEHFISGMQPSTSTTTSLLFKAPAEALTFTLNIELKYTLQSDSSTLLHKILTADLVFVVPFDAKFTFGPIFNPTPWPSYFDSSTKGTQESPDGIAQRWSLGARIASLAAQAVQLQKSEIQLIRVEGDASCDVALSPSEPVQSIQPQRRILSPFELATQKYSLDDRRPSYLDLSLVLTWTRDGIAEATTTTVPVPRLTIPSSEPRVLCTSSSERLDGVDAVIQYHLENPSGHFLTFALTMEANDDYAFSGPKYRTLSLAPLSRHHVEYQIMLHSHVQGDPKEDGGVWISPIFHVVDSYYQKNLRVQPGGIGVKLNEKREPAVFISRVNKEE